MDIRGMTSVIDGRNLGPPRDVDSESTRGRVSEVLGGINKLDEKRERDIRDRLF